MIILILFLAVGAGMVYLAQNNLALVTLQLGAYTFPNLPLFYVIIGSLIVGLSLAYIIYFVNSISGALTLRGKNNKISQTENEIVGLTKQIHQLQLENERLKNHTTIIEPQDENAL